jgi:hypothetical protein
LVDTSFLFTYYFDSVYFGFVLGQHEEVFVKIRDWARLCLVACGIIGFYVGMRAVWNHLAEQRASTEDAAADVLRAIHLAETSRGSPVTAQEMAAKLDFVYEAETDAVLDKNGYKYRPADDYWFALSPDRAHSFRMDRYGQLHVASHGDQVKKKFPVLAWRVYTPRVTAEK